MSTTTTSNATIAGTVEQALTARGYGSYMAQAQPVIEALTAREQAISKHLLEVATESMDLDGGNVRQVLIEAGLSVKEPEPELIEEDDEEDGEEWTDGRLDRLASKFETALDEITRAVGSLTEFARRNGYRG